MAVPVAASARKPLSSSSSKTEGRVVRIIFIALVLDLLAFTMPLPLFPRIIDDFMQHEASQSFSSPTLLSRTLSTVRILRSYLVSFSATSSTSPRLLASNSRFDLTLLGGLLGSTFSFCQFLISPRLGSLSDKYGRKRVLMASMLGNLISAGLWLGSGDSFGVYALSRIVGGLSEGNVQLSIAAISDVTTRQTRSRYLASIGIAFSLAFTLGPSLGAFFASKDWFHLSSTSSSSPPILHLPVLVGGGEIKLNSYAVPAAITVGLLVVETLYLAVCLPETQGWQKEEEGTELQQGGGEGAAQPNERKKSLEERRERLKKLEWVHFGFLFFFSGAEFTITFLTNNLFDFSNSQNGRLLGFIGILSSLLQGGYVRKAYSTPRKTFSLAYSGIRACQFSLLLLASLPFLSQQQHTSATRTPMIVLYLAAAGLAFVSATVVNSLNSLASLETDDTPARDTLKGGGEEKETMQGEGGGEEKEKMKGEGQVIEKGRALGKFRSKGQLGRALGPLFATGLYWCVSPAAAYVSCAIGAMVVARRMGHLKEPRTREEEQVGTERPKEE